MDELRLVIGTIGRWLRLPPDFYLYSHQQLKAAEGRSKYRRITTLWFYYYYYYYYYVVLLEPNTVIMIGVCPHIGTYSGVVMLLH